MTKPRIIVLMAVLLLPVLGAIWGYHLYKTEQQAVTSLNRGMELFRDKKYAESLTELQDIPDGVIQDWRLGYYTGSAMVMLKDFQGAIPELENALKLNPKETLVLFELGVVYFKLGNLGMSKAYFASVIDIDPTNAEARGLMDIMANLERQQPGYSEPQANPDNQAQDVD